MAQRWQVGDVEITCVTEVAFDVPASVLVRDFDGDALTDELSVLQPDYLTDSMLLRIAIQTFAIRSGEHRLLVDTCFGNDHQLPYFGDLRTDHLTSLADAGFDRSTIDSVVCTHLHMDHVGWNTMLVDGAWVPTFPNAQYLFGSIEYDHWRKREQFDAGLVECIDPILEAGLHRWVETDHVITPEVRLVPTPGHTPGHVSVRIDSGGEAALITGDMIHHPVQIVRHEWASVPDFDPVEAVATRETNFPVMADGRVLVLGTHFNEPTGGHIIRRGDRWTWAAQR
ncbi:MAG: fold metallo-hydrolase [Ilumatobacteraceae bacterium]|nr:fold metallo-hydrolase [Ilumatobacteraceae bacterium]